MKTINLVNMEKSDIKYKVSDFPDGQHNVSLITKDLPGYDSEMDWKQHEVHEIQSRFNSFEDLEKILCVTKDLRRLGVKKINLYIPYLLGARSDRKFGDGENSYLVDVIAPIINLQNYEEVTVLDVHSDVAAACINNLKVIDNEGLIAFAMAGLYPDAWEATKENCVLVSPDGGSLKKLYHAVDHLHYIGDIAICSKYRDSEGKLSRIEVPVRDTQLAKDFIIIDDICDGGRTFIEIAKAIKARDGFTGRIYLIVTHGIFSKGFEELGQYFEGIYCTNSVRDVKVDMIGQQTESPGKHCVIKQLNVF